MIRRLAVSALVLAACSSKSAQPLPPAPGGTTASFTLGPSASLPTFFDFPWPTDLRLTVSGTPDFGGFQNPIGTDLLPGLVAIAEERKGFPMVAAGYFRFNAPMAPEDVGTVIPAAATQSLLLIDVDPSSPSPHALFPLVASLEPHDAYVPDYTLAVAARPGFVMRPNNKYAYVVLRSLNDATGQPLGVPSLLWSLAHGVTPSGAEAVATNYAPLWPALQALGIPADQVAAATVFTTGDVVSDLATLSSALVQRDPVQLGPIVLPADGGAVHQGYCELDGTMTLPQYQTGEPPFNTGGIFDAGSDGLPTIQGYYDDVPFVLTFPTGQMPAGGYPLVIYFHGSGGIARAVIDRGTAYQIADGGWLYTLGEGPAWVLAPYGFAAAGAALPLSPDRQDGGSSFYLDDLCASCDDPLETEYLNFSNLAAFRDTFRQGVIESRMFLNVLSTLSIPLSAADLATCGITLPPGETALHYDPTHLVAQGQSMGGMYTNLVSAVEPRIQACVPTGAGGFWSYFVLNSPQVPTVLVPALLESSTNMDWLHPALMLLETAWEPVEPMVYTTRLARRPLPGAPVRPIYEPVGINDSYFSTQTYDAMALAYGQHEAGDTIWDTMQPALALEGLSGFVPYPVSNDCTSESGQPYTGVVAQYVDPTGFDGHALYSQVPGVKHQYACFLSTFLDTGTAVVDLPYDAGLGAPCP
jgi:hypothetical protein